MDEDAEMQSATEEDLDVKPDIADLDKSQKKKKSKRTPEQLAVMQQKEEDKMAELRGAWFSAL